MRLKASLPREVPPLLLLRESVVRRKLPVNFDAQDLPIFSHELEKVIPQAQLLELRNVWVSEDGFLFKGGKILLESFAFPFLFDDWKKRSVIKFLASNYLLKKRRRFAGAALWIVDDWSAGYFHWLADALTRLLTVRDRLAETPLLLPHGYERLEFVRSSLKPFHPGRLEFIGAGEIFLCEKLIVPMHTAPSGHYNEQAIRGVRDVLVKAYGRGAEDRRAERLYISRGGAPKRKIANEEEVIRVLHDFDFRVIRSEEHSFAEQVAIASGARHLVSNHGAGLTNMLFLPAGAQVLELRHATDRINNCYFTLASALDLDYFYQTCSPETPGEDAHTANLVVDTSALRKNIELMLKA